MQIFLSLCSSVSRKISALFCGRSPRDAAIMMLSGQVVDGLMTILAGEMDVKLQSLPHQYDKKQPHELLQVIVQGLKPWLPIGQQKFIAAKGGMFCSLLAPLSTIKAMACRSSGSAAGSDPNKKKRSEGVNPWLYEVFTSQFETVDMAVRLLVPITVLQNHNQYNILQAVICDDLTGLYYLFMNYCSDSGNGKKSSGPMRCRYDVFSHMLFNSTISLASTRCLLLGSSVLNRPLSCVIVYSLIYVSPNQGGQYRQTNIPLKSVRPFEYIEVALQDQEGVEPNREASVYEHLDKFVRNLSDKTAASGSEPKLPLVRVKADYSGFLTIIPQRFGQKYIGKVANPNDILVFSGSTQKHQK
ncbi:hypothetical protein ABZP36_023877 [Zizania latifolia]